MTTRSGGQPGFVGLSRRTRQALGLPEFLPAHRTEVALNACRLLAGEWEAACADERLIDGVVVDQDAYLRSGDEARAFIGAHPDTLAIPSHDHELCAHLEASYD